MDTSSFICALRRFTALRGSVARIRCDRGTNFIGAKGELDQGQITRHLAVQNCEWIFNPPNGSHFGGVWERPIGMIRRILDSMFLQLGKHQLTHHVLITFMAEACAIVNARTITVVSPDGDEPQALTPNMLLTMKSEPSLAPPGDFVREDLYSRRTWRRVQYLADQFWKRWRCEYLQNLQTRRKWTSIQPNVEEGDIVLLREKDVPRNQWPLGRVRKTYPSKGGRVRKVDVVVGNNSTHLRPISELVILEKVSKV